MDGEYPEPTVGGNITDYITGGGDITSDIVEGGCGGGAWMQEFMQALLVALIIVIVFCLWRMMTNNGSGTGFSTAALASRGWYLYTRPGCSWCHKQMDALGGEYKNRIECAADAVKRALPAGAPVCGDSKISGYPFWHNVKTGQSKTGFQDMKALTEMAGASAAGCSSCGEPTVCPPADCKTCTPEICASCKA